MDIRKLQRAIVDGLEDVKASDVVVFNTEHLSPLFERVVVASGNSNRQTKALASSVREAVKAAGGDILSVEGEDNGEWIIVDCGAAVAHIMQPAIRQYYHLEEIWGGKAVKMKMAGPARGLPKASTASDDEDEDVAPSPARKRAAAKSATATAPAKPRTSSRGASASEALKESAPKKAKPRAAAPADRPAGAAPARKPASTAPRKAPAKKVAVKTVAKTIKVQPARKTTTGSTPARKAAPARKPRAA